MSFSATSWAWQAEVSRSSAKLVLLALAECHNGETGLCCPSIKFISRLTGLDRKAIMRGIKTLEDGGFILVDRSDGRHNRYVLKTSTLSGTDGLSGTGASSGTQAVPHRGLERCPIGDTNLEITKKEPKGGFTQENQETQVTQDKQESQAKKKRSLPKGFKVSESNQKWAKEKGFDRLDEHLEYFVGYALANGKQYVDWDRAFQNAVRGNWARLPDKKNTNEEYL